MMYAIQKNIVNAPKIQRARERRFENAVLSIQGLAAIMINSNIIIKMLVFDLFTAQALSIDEYDES